MDCRECDRAIPDGSRVISGMCQRCYMRDWRARERDYVRGLELVAGIAPEHRRFS
jgi:hypothetical protein